MKISYINMHCTTIVVFTYIPINPDFNFFYSQAQRAIRHLYLEAILIVLLLSSQQYIHKYFQTFRDQFKLYLKH